MPALPPAERTIRVRVAGEMNDTVWNNVFYVQYTAGTPAAGDLTTLALDVANLHDAQFGNWLTTTWVIKQVETIDVSSGSGAAGLFTGTLPGAVGGQASPANVAICVSKRLARRYRGGHPRMYLGGMGSSTFADVNTFTPTFVANVETGAKAFLAGINAKTYASTGSIRLVNVSYYYTPVGGTATVLRPTPLVENITDMTVNARVDSMRRRLGR